MPQIIKMYFSHAAIWILGQYLSTNKLNIEVRVLILGLIEELFWEDYLMESMSLKE